MATILSGLNAESFSPYYKRMYIDAGRMNIMLYSDPLLREVEQIRMSQPTQGNNMVIPYQIGRSPNVSKDFAVAQKLAKSNTAQRGNWLIPFDSAFGVGRVDQKTMLSTENNTGAFKQALQNEIDISVYSMRTLRCQDFFSLKPNERGIVKSVTAKVVTLEHKWQAVNFDSNDSIGFYHGTSAIDHKAGTARAGGFNPVDKVNPATGEITFKNAVNGAVVAGDSMIREGDFGEVAMASLNTWIPKSLTGLGSLFGQDRSVNPLRLAGSRVQLTANDNVSAHVRELSSQIASLSMTEGPNAVITNPMTENYVLGQSDANVRYIDDSGSGAGPKTRQSNVGLQFRRADGYPMKTILTPFADPSVLWLVNLQYMALYYYARKGSNRFVDFQYTNGNMFKTSHDDAGVEIRTLSFGNFVIPYPGIFGRVDLDPTNVPGYN